MSRTPSGFSWVVPNLLAAMGRPHNLRQTLEFFKDEGIDVIISLTETPLPSSLVEEFDFEYHHIPVSDFCAPTQAQVREFVETVRCAQKGGRRAVVHCLAGRGRTGTMLACYFVSQGRAPEDALEEVRLLRPGSVETEDQQDAVREYARRLRQERAGPAKGSA